MQMEWSTKNCNGKENIPLIPYVAGYPARGASQGRLRSCRRRRPIGRPRTTWCQPTIPGSHGPAERKGIVCIDLKEVRLG